jgi:AMME syndrome candidate gene 1 protein
MATVDDCYYCFDILYERLFTKRLEKLTAPSSTQKFPLFVTWNIKRGDSWELRGCIGNFNEMALDEGLREYSLVSALRDNRFSPISALEFNQLQCAVSLLLSFEDCLQWDDWDIGKHGIRISFQISSRSYTATYLPFVAFEQSWNHRQTVKSLVRKAGYNGEIDFLKIKVIKYQV